MTNPHRGEKQIALKDKTHQVKLTLDTIVRIESQLGYSILKAAQNLQTGDLSVTDCAMILHKSVRSGGNDVDLKTLQTEMWEAGLADCYKAVGEILAVAIGGGDDEGNAEAVNG